MAALHPKGYHETSVTLQDGRVMRAYVIPGTDAAPAGIPGAGKGMPVAGYILGGVFYADMQPFWCVDAPAEGGARGSVLCTVAGVSAEFTSEKEAGALADELATAGRKALRLAHRLPMLEDDDINGENKAVVGADGDAAASPFQLSPRALSLLSSHPRGGERHLRALQALSQMTGQYSDGNRTLLAVRIVWADWNSSYAVPYSIAADHWNATVSKHMQRQWCGRAAA